MPPLSEPKQDRSRATRLRLLEATVHCVASMGWTASTNATIADAAGISRGALQHHFPTRESLVVAALEYMFDKRTSLVLAVPVPEATGAQRVHSAVEALVEVYSGDLFRAALQVWAAASVDDRVREAVMPLERRFAQEAHRLAVRLLGEVDSDPDVRALVQATLDLCRGLALAGVLTDDSTRRGYVVTAWADQLARGLGHAG
ncbi:TetR/AcrR family transcriptional regulator [Dietzia sp. UBA5065]|jgi:AcrR family transcriptional regulator|uniref:TetR/AcrR family transcriptional regulator n=1 Tax=Dietzia sp. UBA5065 TaxID=1946422 RepID=UPI0025B7B1D9|nr:TetR/AcrR family transcriptional regulator [Dietzia sp. UBA5065]HMT49448.1 TetR/AcrR family transcriptional regulator [Dietzia sp.]